MLIAQKNYIFRYIPIQAALYRQRIKATYLSVHVKTDGSLIVQQMMSNLNAHMLVHSRADGRLV
jgi:hypothetical protein